MSAIYHSENSSTTGDKTPPKRSYLDHQRSTYKIQVYSSKYVGNCKISCNAEHLGNIPLREIHLTFKMALGLKILFTIRNPYILIKAYASTTLSCRLIWCDGTFKIDFCIGREMQR
jgi:hypothetical protein